jgi:hypothetical protein
MRLTAMEADDSPARKEAARARLRELRAAIKPGDALSLMKTGYWAAAMHSIRIVPDTDGPALITQAAALRPNDASYQFVAALAYLDQDKARARAYWTRARELAKPGSATARNLAELREVFGFEAIASR